MVTPNFFTSSSSLLSTLLTATFSYCSMSSATCKHSGPRVSGQGVAEPPAPLGMQQDSPAKGAQELSGTRDMGLQDKQGINAPVPTSLPTKELLFSKISAKYLSLFLWKKL